MGSGCWPCPAASCCITSPCTPVRTLGSCSTAAAQLLGAAVRSSAGRCCALQCARSNPNLRTCSPDTSALVHFILHHHITATPHHAILYCRQRAYPGVPPHRPRPRLLGLVRWQPGGVGHALRRRAAPLQQVRRLGRGPAWACPVRIRIHTHPQPPQYVRTPSMPSTAPAPRSQPQHTSRRPQLA